MVERLGWAIVLAKSWSRLGAERALYRFRHCLRHVQVEDAGQIKDGLSSLGLSTSASACAAAASMCRSMSRALASSKPRNTPGKASTLLIWLGSSLRPVATTAACRRASAGSTSGSGLASAKTIKPAAIVAMSSPRKIAGALTPMRMSAPASASRSVPVTACSLVCSTSQRELASSRHRAPQGPVARTGQLRCSNPPGTRTPPPVLDHPFVKRGRPVRSRAGRCAP